MAKKETIKLNESKLRNIISNIVKEGINEFRGDTPLDGDNGVISPKTGEPYSYHVFKKDKQIGKRDVSSSVGKHTSYKSGIADFEINRGKGKMLSDLLTKFEEDCKEICGVDITSYPFKSIGKVEWTKRELDEFSKIRHILIFFPELTKIEGNKKRGYDGPSESEKGQAAPALALAEQKIRNIVRSVLKEWDDEYDMDPEERYGEGETGETVTYSVCEAPVSVSFPDTVPGIARALKADNYFGQMPGEVYNKNDDKDMGEWFFEGVYCDELEELGIGEFEFSVPYSEYNAEEKWDETIEEFKKILDKLNSFGETFRLVTPMILEDFKKFLEKEYQDICHDDYDDLKAQGWGD